MTLHTYPDIEQGTEDWHAIRRGIVTASVVGQLITTRRLTGIDFECCDCGALPHAPCVSKVKRVGEIGAPIKTLHAGRTESAAFADSPPILEAAVNDQSRSLTAVLTAERINGFTDPSFMSSDVWRGVEDEPVARDVYSEHYAPVTECGFMSLVEGWGTLGYSPDGLVGDDGLIEVKSRRSKTQLLTVLDGEVPDANMAQLQAGLFVSGRQWIDYCSFAGGMRMWVKRVWPDPAWFEAIQQAVEMFERTAVEMEAAYWRGTDGMPMTERALRDLEMVI